jgi:hypothetical protein
MEIAACRFIAVIRELDQIEAVWTSTHQAFSLPLAQGRCVKQE